MSRSSLMSAMPVERVVVEVHLGVEREQAAVFGDDERIDLDERRVGRVERLVERRHQLAGLRDLRACRARARTRACASGTPESPTPGWMNSLKMRSGVSCATFSISTPPSWLTISTGFSVARSRTMPRYSSRLIGKPLLDEHALDDLALGTGLIGHQAHADDCLGRRFRRVGALDDLDAAALAAAAGVNLRLDDDRSAAEALGGCPRLGGVEHDFALRHRYAVRREDCLGLILVNFHDALRMHSGSHCAGAAHVSARNLTIVSHDERFFSGCPRGRIRGRSSCRRISSGSFSSSVGTKLLIGLTGLALVALPGPASGRQRS